MNGKDRKMSVECPKCHQQVVQVCRCSKCHKVKCNSTLSRGSVRLGCSAKEPGQPYPGATHAGCGGKWEKYR